MERESPSIDPAFWTRGRPGAHPERPGRNRPAAPVSGRTVAIAVHPTNPDIVYVGAAQGGVYRSTGRRDHLDAGSSTPRDVAGDRRVGTRPSNPEILYVGTGRAQRLRGRLLRRRDRTASDNASATANLTGPINPLVTTGVPGTEMRSRPFHQRDRLVDPAEPGHHLRLDVHRRRWQPAGRVARLHGASAEHAGRLPLDQRDDPPRPPSPS